MAKCPYCGSTNTSYHVENLDEIALKFGAALILTFMGKPDMAKSQGYGTKWKSHRTCHDCGKSW